MARDSFSRILAQFGIDSADVDDWFARTEQLPADVEVVFDAFRWATRDIGECARQLSTPVLDYLRATRPPTTLRAEAMHLDRTLAKVIDRPESVLDRTEHAVAALLALIDPRDDSAAGAIRRFVPEWRALTNGSPTFATGEHDPARAHPLLENLAERTLNRSLRALETGRRDIFPSGPSLSGANFERHRAALGRIEAAGLLPAVRAALLFLDFTKGGDASMRAEWTARGFELALHNRASRDVLEHTGRLDHFPQLRAPGRRELVLALVEVHGMTGQIVRGESTWVMLEPIAHRLGEAVSSGADLSADLVVDALHIVNVCDTAAVRFDLWTDGLAEQFAELEGVLRTRIGDSGETAPDQPSLFALEMARHEGPEAWLRARLSRLRRRRLVAGEPQAEIDKAVASVGAEYLDGVVEQLSLAQIWYGEAATADLRASSQLKLLAMSSLAVTRAGRELHHVNLAPLMDRLNDGSRTADYRVRLLDAVLERLSFADILAGRVDTGPLVTFETTIGGAAAGSVDLSESAEATALLTLLPIYETKNSAAFHRTLKEMCDLYDLRKDEFDRVSNEKMYLEHMNSARSDKERMVDWCVPGRIVEVGPGGGVVLDLLERAFPDSEVVGLDLSAMVCEALRDRKAREGHQWTIIEGDAYDLPKHAGTDGATTIVYCSVLHEIYSYVQWPRDSGDGEQFRLESVRELIRASWLALRPGGRVVIRDGIQPADDVRRIRFKDPHGPEFLELFAEQFEGRSIRYDWVDATTAQLSAADAMEFLYCYTWGPASFPYEVREQYGVMQYDDYVGSLVEWVSDLPGRPVIVDLPADERSYLQPGYIDGLAPKIDLLDANDEPVSLPDSNCLIVLEKQGE